MNDETASPHDLLLLEQIEQNPDASQASLAAYLGVAIGTVNWHIKRLINKGYVKVKRIERRKLRYIITPEGLSLRAHLTIDYIQTSFKLYRYTRERVLTLLEQVKEAGYTQVRVTGDGDMAEICRLTCLEQAVAVTEQDDCPTLEVAGLKVILHMNHNDKGEA
ncbi:MAG TPA: winged helix-turn-helix transcriptional regulator [Anaerolineaceae bacterium]|nr:winged helix-turn-helix transcriptional regulator [Anaerolineaceae bacterium]HPN53327.1 winged helix-turn-helix transcriptional regulator [Anaerolineaceae bacterium]